MELDIECEQLDARVQVAVYDARLELQAAHELSAMAALEHAAPFRSMRAKRDATTARMVHARIKWMKLAGLMLLFALVACGDNLCGTVTLVDAPPPVDAALPTCTFDDEQRSLECKLICAADFVRCPGATGNDCYDECVLFSTGTFYCPPMSTAQRAPRKGDKKAKAKKRGRLGPALRSSARTGVRRNTPATRANRGRHTPAKAEAKARHTPARARWVNEWTWQDERGIQYAGSTIPKKAMASKPVPCAECKGFDRHRFGCSRAQLGLPKVDAPTHPILRDASPAKTAALAEAASKDRVKVVSVRLTYAELRELEAAAANAKANSGWGANQGAQVSVYLRQSALHRARGLLVDKQGTPAEWSREGLPNRGYGDWTNVSLEDFAAYVNATAKHVHGTGVFGGRKVFIFGVWRWRDAFGDMELDDFKARLVEAHKKGLVTLSRADLTGAMDPELVRMSETRHLESTYHFIERDA